MSNDDTFFGLNTTQFKGVRFFVCQSGWQLYIALQAMQNIRWDSDVGSYTNRLTKEQYKNIIKSIPGDPHPTCRCKDCRYHRVVKKCSK